MNPVLVLTQWLVPAGFLLSGMFALCNVGSQDSTARFAKIQFVVFFAAITIYTYIIYK